MSPAAGARRPAVVLGALAVLAAVPACGSSAGSVRVEIVRAGDGALVADGDRIQVRYRGYLAGHERPFEENWSRGVTVVVGESPVVPGWHAGLRGLTLGSVARLHVPAELGYGERGHPPLVPPGADLVFDVRIDGAGP
jgi:FKBP-type peptidyl-prolyl cis-trans isomerase